MNEVYTLLAAEQSDKRPYYVDVDAIPNEEPLTEEDLARIEQMRNDPRVLAIVQEFEQLPEVTRRREENLSNLHRQIVCASRTLHECYLLSCKSDLRPNGWACKDEERKRKRDEILLMVGDAQHVLGRMTQEFD